MFAFLGSIAPAACLLLSGAGASPEGYLLVRPPGPAGALLEKAVPYAPREGDLIFYDDYNKAWTALFAVAGTGPPMHMGIVVKDRDGSLVVLESGPDYVVWVEMIDVGPRLRQFDLDYRGDVTVRRCKKALTREQSAALTKFALAQNGKRYAVLRLLQQGTLLRARGPFEPMLAGTHLDRSSWICSELAVAAGTVAGLFDPRAVRSNVTYPRDLIDNRKHALGAVWEDLAEWRPSRQPSGPIGLQKGPWPKGLVRGLDK